MRLARAAMEITQEQLAEYVGLSVSQISRFENGEREPRLEEAQKIADVLHLALADILPDENGVIQFDHTKKLLPSPNRGRPARGKVPVVGIVSAGPHAEISFEPGLLGFVAPPPRYGKNTVAVEVRGTSIRGYGEDGWFVYYDDKRPTIESHMIGQLCVVGLEDGRTMVKIPYQGRKPGHFDLESTHAETLRDVRVIWAARVTALMPPWSAKID